MPFAYLEEIATADVAFRAWGETLEGTFVAAGEATMNVMVEALDAIRPLETRRIELSNDALDMLLFDFLQELIYYKDADYLLLRVPSVALTERNGDYHLRAEAAGEALNVERHSMVVDVKAVTLHQFALEQRDDGWEARVILDI